MSATTWLIYGGSAVAGVAIGALVITRTPWYRIRSYAVELKKIFDRHKVQEKAQAVQSLAAGGNPNPMLMKKPLRDLTSAYQAMLADLEKMKVPKKATDVHAATITMHKESMQLYQMAAVGGFRQKALVDKQKKLQGMEKALQEKMEALYGPMKKPEEMTGLSGRIARWLAKIQKK